VGDITHLCSKFHKLSSNKKFEKSISILQSYREFKGENFFETQCSSYEDKIRRTVPYE